MMKKVLSLTIVIALSLTVSATDFYDDMTVKNWNRGGVADGYWTDVYGAATVTATHSNQFVYPENTTITAETHYYVMSYGTNYYARLHLGVMILYYHRDKSDYVAVLDGTGWKYHYSSNDVNGNHEWKLVYHKDKSYTVYRDGSEYATGSVSEFPAYQAYTITSQVNNKRVRIYDINITAVPIGAPPIFSEFDDAVTTNFSSVDYSSVDQPVIANSYARVRWYGSGFDFNDLDLDQNIEFQHNFVSVNSTALSGLNASANITMEGVSYSSNDAYVILRDGVPCGAPDCVKIDYAPVKFNVSGFSNYTTTGGSAIPEFNAVTVLVGLMAVAVFVVVVRKRR